MLPCRHNIHYYTYSGVVGIIPKYLLVNVKKESYMYGRIGKQLLKEILQLEKTIVYCIQNISWMFHLTVYMST
jgi:hypothetical protein